MRLSLTRLHHDKIVIFGHNAEGFVLRVYDLPPSIMRDCDSKRRYLCLTTSDTFLEWGALVAQFTREGLRNPFTDAFHIPSTPEKMLTLMFSEGSSTEPYERIVRFPLPSAAFLALNTQPRVNDVRVRSPADNSIRLVGIGASGRRAVWLEHNLETTRSRLMKFEIGGFEDGEEGVPKLFHGVLLSPDPPLPFSTDACHSLAFDEATCRLCLGLWDGSLHILDFL